MGGAVSRGCPDTDNSGQDLLQTLESINNVEDRYLISTLEEIKERLTMLERSVANISRSSTREVTLPDDVTLPLQSYQDLDTLEQKMEDQQCWKDLV